MSGNRFGKLFSLTTFGESHGTAIGGVIDGCPPGFSIDFNKIQAELDRRKPGQSSIVTPRSENDQVEFLSGFFEEKTTGTPIGFIVKNNDQKSEDYSKIKDKFRPSHADYTYEAKYGIRDYRGGGRSSARETIARVIAGAIAKQILDNLGIQIIAYVSQVGSIKTSKSYKELDFNLIEKSTVRCPDPDVSKSMIELIELVKSEGDTVGGIISAVVKGVPAGLGEPVFDKLHAELGKAMLSINAAKAFEIGNGFDSVSFKGSELNDEFIMNDGKITTKTNNSGGIQGGISNGQDITFRVAFKPVSSIRKAQNSVSKSGEEVTLETYGRHDPCVLPRAVPIVEAMAALVILDYYLIQQSHKLA
jgi:chorismate synthase